MYLVLQNWRIYKISLKVLYFVQGLCPAQRDYKEERSQTISQSERSLSLNLGSIGNKTKVRPPPRVIKVTSLPSSLEAPSYAGLTMLQLHRLFSKSHELITKNNVPTWQVKD